MTLVSPSRRSFRRRCAALLVGGGILGLLAGCGADPSNVEVPVETSRTDAESVTIDGTTMPPWPAPIDVAPRVASAGLDLGPMGMAEHYHPELRIVIGGQDVVVPANIGVDLTSGAMSSLHTHEADGTIHVEADSLGEVFTLGQLFTQWGVKLTPTQIGGATAKAGQEVSLTSNGEPVEGDPRDLRLEPEQTILLQL